MSALKKDLTTKGTTYTKGKENERFSFVLPSTGSGQAFVDLCGKDVFAGEP